jgi:7-carboxy-7-deazaguanine synthase
MALLRLSEIYQSVQGEGPRTGEPTTFVRFAGCNLRCPGWPCDTPYAIFPELIKKDVRVVSPNELARLTPSWPNNVCLTGGEPMLQNNKCLEYYVEQLRRREQHVEMFSNGTLPYPEKLAGTWRPATVLDWKLRSAGDDLTKWKKTRWGNLRWIRDLDTIKFTVMDKDDLGEAMEEFFRIVDYLDGTSPSYYVGPVWNTHHTLPAEIVDFILEHQLPWHLNLQTHKFIWPASERGI